MQKRNSMRQLLTASWLLCIGGALTFGNALAASDDPPDRVARISFLKGDVSLQPAGTSEWAPATLNRPLTTDDQVSVDRDGRVELQVGSATIHLNAGAAFSFSELSDSVLQARVTDGAMHLTVRRIQEGEVIEIDTPHAAVTITKPGDYRIEVLGAGTRTLVKTYEGQADVAGNGESVRLQAREQIMLEEGQAVAASEALAPRDEFDNWAQDRNERFTQSASSRYVAPDVIGYEDLDSHGDWATEADYGHVWYPRIAVGWAPYRYGHWAWVSPWGWTWVDNAPWGFAPFHYGRWAHVHGRWGWVPGPVHVRAVYAPALVGWVGTPGFSVSVSFGTNVGWFPLAPREVYVPGYYCSPRYIHNVNYSNTVIVNNTIINRAYVNRSTHIDYKHRGHRDAVTVVSRDAFVSARPVSNHIVRNRDIGGWKTHNAAPAIAPERASTMGPRWDAKGSRSPDRWNGHDNRKVVSRHKPPTSRTSFEQEQHAIRSNNNRPIPRGDLHKDSRNESMRLGNVSTKQDAGQRNGTLFRDEHPRRTFERAKEVMQPNSAAPKTDNRAANRGHDGFQRGRETAAIDTRRIESPRTQERSELPRTQSPRTESPQTEARRFESPRTESPRVRESAEPQVRRQFERPVERQPDRRTDHMFDRMTQQQSSGQARGQSERQSGRQQDHQWVQPQANVERPRQMERAARAEAPRQYQPPPQREQRQEQVRQHAPAAAPQARAERHEGRGNRHGAER